MWEIITSIKPVGLIDSLHARGIPAGNLSSHEFTRISWGYLSPSATVHSRPWSHRKQDVSKPSRMPIAAHEHHRSCGSRQVTPRWAKIFLSSLPSSKVPQATLTLSASRKTSRYSPLSVNESRVSILFPRGAAGKRGNRTSPRGGYERPRARLRLSLIPSVCALKKHPRCNQYVCDHRAAPGRRGKGGGGGGGGPRART